MNQAKNGRDTGSANPSQTGSPPATGATLKSRHDLSQRLSRARLVYLRRDEARWGWLALCLVLMLGAPRVDAREIPGTGSLLLGTGENPYVAPPLSTDIDVSVSGPLARVSVKQRFINPSDEWVEGRYLFPLPEGSAVDKLLITTPTSVIEGEIREIEQAKKAYQQAKAAGKRAGVVEQKRGNLFSLALANIGPGEEVTVSLAYRETLEFNHGRYDLRLPLTLTQRYQPAIATVANANAPMPALYVTDRDDNLDTSYVSGMMAPTANISVSVLGDRWPENIGSSSHAVQLGRHADRTDVIVDGGFAAMDRDFVMSWQPASGSQPEMMVLTERWQQHDYALLMFLPPDPGAIQALPRELVLVIDTSGSMHGESIDQARKAVAQALATLGSGDRFNVIRFSDDASSLFDAPVGADSVSLAQARDFVSHLSADGGTNMAPALAMALSSGGNIGYLRQVVFITDGAIGDEQGLLAAITQRLGDSRLFTVGIGPAPNSHFMRKAARYGRGSYTFINDTTKVAAQMSGLLVRLEKPALKNIEIHWPDGLSVEQWPERVPDLYVGEPMMVSVRLDHVPGSLTVSGDSASGRWQTTQPLVATTDAPGVAAIWARNKIDSLLDRAIAAGDRQAARPEVVLVALAHGLVSPFTSMIAVEKQQARPAGSGLANLRVASAAPRNMEMLGFPRTATNAGVWRLAGLLLLALSLTWLGLDRRARA